MMMLRVLPSSARRVKFILRLALSLRVWKNLQHDVSETRHVVNICVSYIRDVSNKSITSRKKVVGAAEAWGGGVVLLSATLDLREREGAASPLVETPIYGSCRGSRR